MKFFKKTKQNLENTFDEKHLKQDVESGKLERGSFIWGIRAATIGLKETVREIVGRTVTVANSERDKLSGSEKPQNVETTKEVEKTTKTDLDEEMREFEEWKEFRAYKRKQEESK
jgi:hypothetical protein